MMKITTRNRKTESLVYSGLWLLVISLYLLDVMRNRAYMSQPLIDFSVIAAMSRTLLPFFVLFIVNNATLIPRLLFKNRVLPYFLAVAAVVMLLWLYQYFNFIHEIEHLPKGIHPKPHPYMRPLLPLPLFLDFTYALLVIGGNLAIALMFQRFDDKLEKESLMKTNAENQLAYLKAQINPHFYMNMLNNIHGMIEIDPEKAQDMVLDMSRLMRYMLYDCSRSTISLSDEVAFLNNYLSLMRQRFPEHKVSITSKFPSAESMHGISIPPLLFLVFIENAFKHGVSYRESSFVSISVEIDGNTVRFSCMNSNHSKNEGHDSHHGIGLRNITQRLSLLYGSKARLEISNSPSSYTVNLDIPSNETENTDN